MASNEAETAVSEAARASIYSQQVIEAVKKEPILNVDDGTAVVQTFALVSIANSLVHLTEPLDEIAGTRCGHGNRSVFCIWCRENARV